MLPENRLSLEAEVKSKNEMISEMNTVFEETSKQTKKEMETYEQRLEEKETYILEEQNKYEETQKRDNENIVNLKDAIVQNNEEIALLGNKNETLLVGLELTKSTLFQTRKVNDETYI